jgi:predicted RNA-binding Zn ribbon-like protein
MVNNNSGDHARRRFGADDFVGGALALDFLNTVDDARTPTPVERLAGFEDWLAWARTAGLPVERGAAPSGRRTAQFMRELHAFRDEWRDVLDAALAGRKEGAAALEAFNRHWRRANGARSIRATPAGHVHEWAAGTPGWQRAFHTVVLSAAELLTDRARLARVHECPAADCGWVFLDTSRNASRRWCSMKTCGNLDKVRRFYARQRTD